MLLKEKESAYNCLRQCEADLSFSMQLQIKLATQFRS